MDDLPISLCCFFSFLIGFSEALIGIFLIFPEFSSLATFSAILLHISILIFVSPWGLNDVAVVFWNVLNLSFAIFYHLFFSEELFRRFSMQENNTKTTTQTTLFTTPAMSASPFFTELYLRLTNFNVEFPEIPATASIFDYFPFSFPSSFFFALFFTLFFLIFPFFSFFQKFHWEFSFQLYSMNTPELKIMCLEPEKIPAEFKFIRRKTGR